MFSSVNSKIMAILLSAIAILIVTSLYSLLQEIVTAVGKINNMNLQIATAANEQTSVAENITRVVTEIRDVAVRNVDQADQAKHVSQRLTRLAENVEKQLKRFTSS